MRIAIIGAGHIGGTLTRRLTALGHAVTVANSREPGTLADLAKETGAYAAWASEAAQDAEVVVISIPEKSIPALPGNVLMGALPNAAVVDTGNYYPSRDGRIEAIERGMPESVWVVQELGHTVVKAFNNIPAADLFSGGRPSLAEGRIALPVAGDGIGPKAVVMTLIDELGFDPVDAGDLSESWRQQPGTPVYGANLHAAGVRAALAAASPERPAAFRA